MISLDVYWIGGLRWTALPRRLWQITGPRRRPQDRTVRAQLQATWQARKPWQRRWQAEWPGCQRAVRGWTHDGTWRKALRVMAAHS